MDDPIQFGFLAVIGAALACVVVPLALGLLWLLAPYALAACGLLALHSGLGGDWGFAGIAMIPAALGFLWCNARHG